MSKVNYIFSKKVIEIYYMYYNSIELPFSKTTKPQHARIYLQWFHFITKFISYLI